MDKGPGEMAQRLGVLAGLPKTQVPFPSQHNYLQLSVTAVPGDLIPFLTAHTRHMQCTDVYADQTLTHIN